MLSDRDISLSLHPISTWAEPAGARWCIERGATSVLYQGMSLLYRSSYRADSVVFDVLLYRMDIDMLDGADREEWHEHLVEGKPALGAFPGILFLYEHFTAVRAL